MTTPFDNRIVWIHWMGEVVAEDTIAELAETVTTYSPNVKGIAIKTNDGEDWQARYDSKAAMAIGSQDDIAKWSRELARFGLQTHLWCVVKGRNVDEEARVIVEAARAPGVRSMLLDVEVGQLYFGGQSPETARRLIRKISTAIPNNVHLGLNFDARGTHPQSIHIDEWLPYVHSLHPMVYHWHFSEATRGPRQYLDEAFRVCEKWNLPIVPMLQAYPDPATGLRVPTDHLYEAGIYAFQLGAAGITYFRLGTAGPPEFDGVSRIDPNNIPRDGEPGDTRTFQVVTLALNVREEPTLEDRVLLPEEQLRMGEQVKAEVDSRTDNQGFVWWKHESGWSAEKTSDNSEIFLVDVSEDPPVPDFYFQRLPVDLDTLQWFYYYGNTLFAYLYGRIHGYHRYSQGLHGGLDFGHPGGVPIFAGVSGTFEYGGSRRAFPPNRVDIRVGDYTIIYGHIANPLQLPQGTPVTPDTVVGEMDFGAKHLHLEIRYDKQLLILNPLRYLQDATRDALIDKFPPVDQYRFYRSARWNRWLTPLDQPAIVRGGPVIGPTANI